MALEHAIRAHLAGKTEITAVCDNRVLFGDIDASREVRPHIVFTIHDADALDTLDGTKVDLQFPVINVEIRAEDPAHIVTLNDLVRRSLLELATGATIGSENVEELTLIDSGTDEETETIREDDETVEVLRRSLIAQVGYRYSTAAVT